MDRQVRTSMETYHGHVKTPADAIILFEACRLGNLPRVQRRLSERERQMITSGSVFVWDEREAGMRRWTDGKSWSASRVSGSFLTYREMEGPDGYRYKPDGLMKQSFSITTAAGQHLHLISYYARSHPTASQLASPSSDPALRHIRPAKGMYPESTVHDAQSMPAVTRSPMASSPYSTSPSHQHASHYLRHPPPHMHAAGYGYPPSPLGTPPAHYSPYQPGYHHANGGPPAPASSGHPSPYPPLQQGYSPHQGPPPGPTAFDRAPPPLKGYGVPPPPPPAPAQSYPQHQPQYQAQTSHPGPYSEQRSEYGAAAPPPRRSPQPQPQYPSQRQEDRPQPPPLYNVNGNHAAGSTPPEQPKTIPSINSLINGSPPAPPAPQPQPHAASLPMQRNESGSGRGDGSRNGTPDGLTPRSQRETKDIPESKIGMSVDDKALRQLDRAFAA